MTRVIYKGKILFEEFIQWLLNLIFGWGYIGIFLLMAMESSFIPVPSELILIPAGILVAKGKMNLELVFFIGLLGSLFGTFITYYLAMFIGRNFLKRYGKYFFISQLNLDKMDSFFDNHGHISTFTGRLIPGLRHLISIPAGLTKMNLKIFLVYSAAGSAIWSIILLALGYFLGMNQEMINLYLHQIMVILMISIGVLIVGYLWYKKK